MSKNKNTDLDWANVKLTLNGLDIDILPFEYKESSDGIPYKPIIMEIYNFSIDYRQDITDKKIEQHINFNSKNDMLIALKRIGIVLVYGKGEFPVSVKHPEEYKIDDVGLKLLSGIKQEEWNKVE